MERFGLGYHPCEFPKGAHRDWAGRLPCGCINCITPPHMLKRLLESDNKEIRQAALDTLLATARLRGERDARMAFAALSAPGNGRRTIFNCHNSIDLASATMERSEDGPESSDDSANRAFEGFGKTREFYKTVFDRNSVDNRGMRLDGYVHRGLRFNNALWDGREMIFGDGDGVMFTDFTKSVDVIAHELTHGVTQFTAGLEYHNQSGALNESISDVFGSLVKQWSLNQTAEAADWLIGSEVFTPEVEGDALRSVKEPGTAYDNPTFGKDPQPNHMSKYVHLPDNEDGDYGGVHINSGIPNKAFYLTAVGIGGFAWEAPGIIWYESLKASSPTTDFQQFADNTYEKAGSLFGSGGAQQQAVLDAWRQVGVRISGSLAGAVAARTRAAVPARESAALGMLTKQLESLSSQVKALAKEVSGLKAKK
jgi:Zn-dependent metalloprotease